MQVAAAIVEDTDAIVDILLGNDERLLELNNETLLAAQFSVEIVDVIKAEFDTPYEQGWWTGRIVGEVVLEIATAMASAGAANLAKWASKSATPCGTAACRMHPAQG